MKRVLALLLLSWSALGCGAAAAADAVEVGRRAETWMEMQRRNVQAVPPKPVSGAVAARIYDRYLRSFEQPIPPSLLDERDFSID